MFVHTLTEKQQSSFFSLAKQFLHADAVLSAEEKNLLELLVAEAGGDPSAEIPDGDLDELLAAFDSRQSRATVLLELIGMAHADENFCPDESRFILSVGERLGLSREEVNKMNDWVTRQMSLAAEVEGFWEEPAG